MPEMYSIVDIFDKRVRQVVMADSAAYALKVAAGNTGCVYSGVLNTLVTHDGIFAARKYKEGDINYEGFN